MTLRQRLVCVAMMLASLLACSADARSAERSAEAQAALRTLGAGTTLRGMHDTIGGEQAEGFRMVADVCGRSPDLWSSDFGYSRHPNDSTDYRRQLAAKALRLGRQGVLVTLSWHQCSPVVDEPCTFGEGLQGALDSARWQELLTDGTSLNRRWKRQMDRLAQPLQRLQQQKVPVLLRPYHEANLPGFWWASTDPAHFKALWRQLRTYYEQHWRLDNLLWVWSVSYHPKYWERVADYYPGEDAVDVVGLDIYPPTREGLPAFATAWAALRQIGPDKPLALSEVSRLPPGTELVERPWAYVVPWGQNMLLRDNPVRNICDFYGR